MPLSPSEALAKSRDDVAYEVIAVATKIDKALTTRYHGGTFLFSPVPIAPVAEAIVRLYEAKGWSVRRVFDQRDGDFMEFKPR